jgi:hypothetical protein
MFIGIAYQEVPMPSDSSYNIGVTDNGDTYTGTILNGSGHLRVRVDPDCVTVDYVAAWLPQDTLGANKNCEIRHTQSLFRILCRWQKQADFLSVFAFLKAHSRCYATEKR